MINKQHLETALQLIKNTDFLYIDVNSESHLDVLLTLFIENCDDDWSVKGSYEGKFNLFCNDDLVLRIKGDLHDILSEFVVETKRENEINSYESDLYENDNHDWTREHYPL